MTFPKKLEDVPAHKLGAYPGDDKKNLYYYDDIYVGYRYYDTYNAEPEFPFGFGLSYTTFSYSNLKIAAANKKATVAFTVKNTGKVAGADVAQVYVHQQKSALPRPQKELKGFQKVFLQPGQSKTVTITLDENAFQYFNDNLNKWVSEPGRFDILIGNSSRDIRLTGTANL